MSCLPDPTFAPVRQTSKSKVLYRQILTRERRCRCRSRHNRPRRARYREAVRPGAPTLPQKAHSEPGHASVGVLSGGYLYICLTKTC